MNYLLAVTALTSSIKAIGLLRSRASSAIWTRLCLVPFNRLNVFFFASVASNNIFLETKISDLRFKESLLHSKLPRLVTSVKHQVQYI